MSLSSLLCCRRIYRKWCAKRGVGTGDVHNAARDGAFPQTQIFIQSLGAIERRYPAIKIGIEGQILGNRRLAKQLRAGTPA
jgi:hypothetical protein